MHIRFTRNAEHSRTLTMIYYLSLSFLFIHFFELFFCLVLLLMKLVFAFFFYYKKNYLLLCWSTCCNDIMTISKISMIMITKTHLILELQLIEEFSSLSAHLHLHHIAFCVGHAFILNGVPVQANLPQEIARATLAVCRHSGVVAHTASKSRHIRNVVFYHPLRISNQENFISLLVKFEIYLYIYSLITLRLFRSYMSYDGHKTNCCLC